ncbi:MAG: S41 family peptidase [Porphyromonas sp.]|nr:S41 family peptidase [Porphyromonas sp.]
MKTSRLFRETLFALLCFFLLGSATLNAQTSLLWPIKDKTAGSDILFKPQDKISEELNTGSLFIGSPIGTEVLVPADGVVQSSNLVYYLSLSYVLAFNYAGDFDKAIEQNKKTIEEKYGPARYLTGAITIKLANGDKISISGIKPQRLFRSGEKIRRGEVLGTVLYSYKKIGVSSISVAISNAQGRPTDPMTPFGLKSTFKAPTIVKPKPILTGAEAKADYRQLADAVKEIYPSLTDLMSIEEYDAFVSSEIARLPEKISREEFGKRITAFNQKIHDSHLSIDIYTHAKEAYPMLPEIFYGKLEGKVVAMMSTAKYRSYLGKEIVKINGQDVNSLELNISPRHLIYDGQVSSHRDRALALNYPTFIPKANKSGRKPNTTTLTFADGKEVTVPMFKQGGSIPYGVEAKGFFNIFGANRYRTQFKLKELNDTTAYIGLSTFFLNEVETDEVVAFIRKMRDKEKPSMIFDLRNNPGGSIDVLYTITKELIESNNSERNSYSKVNAHLFKTPTMNLIPSDSLFTQYRPLPDKEGLYLMPKSSPAPSDSVRNIYKGRLYVLIDAGSASASTEFAGSVKYNRRGTIIGRETSTAYHCFTAVKFANIELKYSKFTATIPMVRCVFDETVNDRFPKGRGVIPDINIPISLEEIHSSDDYLIRRTLEQIRKDL